jgi:hypothetical protein
MAPRHPDAITRLYRACEPNEALQPTDPRYVNCDAVRGENVVLLYERSLRRAEPEGREVKLFAGHRGVGKTSELLRLKANLERPGHGSEEFFVVYFDVDRSLDVNDLDFPDLLALTAAEMQRQIAAAAIPGLSATTTYLGRLWDEIVSTLGADLRLTEAEAEIPFARLSFEIRNRPTQRQLLRAAIEQRATPLIEALNDLLRTARAALRKAGKQGLVLLIDGLDKLVRRELEEGSGNTHERLFFDRSDQLASLDAHVVYTVPISLIYSPRCSQLEQTFGEHNLPIPMIRLREANRGTPTLATPGMQKLAEILQKRCEFAEVPIEQAFASETIEYLCRMSGGHPRHLLMFVQSATNHIDELPVTHLAAEQAVRNYANSLLREVPDEAWGKLGPFDKPRDEMPKDDLHQQMLYYLWVFEYMNGKPWWEVNPVLRTLDRYQRASGD